MRTLIEALRALFARLFGRTPPRYPEGFLWGAALSAHQTEGVAGGGEQGDWYRFEHETRNGKPTIAGGDTADVATDFWARYDEDFRLARLLGLSTLRTSIAWEKVNPEPGVLRADVLDHYRRIFGTMRDRGLRPMIALHHFTHPTWFHERGGWTADEAPSHFLRYAERVLDRLGDLCDLWITFNEPMILVEMGYLKGIVPPLVSSLADAYEAAYQIARAHRLVAAMIHARQGASPDARGAGGQLRGVGIAHAVSVFDPFNPLCAADRRAAAAVADLATWSFLRGLTGDRLSFPMPAEVPDAVSFERAFPPGETSGDAALDWIGVNYYTRWLIRHAPASRIKIAYRAPRGPRGDNGWAIAPAGLERALRDTAKVLPGVPLVVSENGMADARDDRRPAFLRDHLAVLDRLIRSGLDVRGYWHWSLTDNFEWLEGYRMRFGLAAVHYDRDLAREPRPSAHVYASAIRARGPARAPTPFSDPYRDGYVLALWDTDLPREALESLFARVAATGARHVTIPVFGCQTDIRSGDVGSCEVASRRRALDLARAGRDHGFSVGFLPIVAGKRWEWRGHFEPADRAAWFLSYTRWIVDLAREARAIGASELVVGTELTRLYRRDEEWARVLAAVRGEFGGPLIVTVNWSDLDLGFWEDADAIGVSAYHPLSARDEPTQEALDAGWREVRDAILRVAEKHRRPVHISEIGYPTMAHAAARPWDGDTASPADPALQARCFEAFRRAWEGRRELVRFDVWAAGDPRSADLLGFETFGKPAEEVIRRMFAERARYRIS
jgi:beta-glucosidase